MTITLQPHLIQTLEQRFSLSQNDEKFSSYVNQALSIFVAHSKDESTYSQKEKIKISNLLKEGYESGFSDEPFCVEIFKRKMNTKYFSKKK